MLVASVEHVSSVVSHAPPPKCFDTHTCHPYNDHANCHHSYLDMHLKLATQATEATPPTAATTLAITSQYGRNASNTRKTITKNSGKKRRCCCVDAVGEVRKGLSEPF